MARPGSVPITRLRFRGRANTLNALCRSFRDQPRQTFTAGELAARTGRDFRDVYQRLSETPELFFHMPKKAGGITRYRLASAVERMNDEETAAFIDAETRLETRNAIAVIAGIIALGVLAGVLSAYD
jgi:hypothetical protein